MFDIFENGWQYTKKKWFVLTLLVVAFVTFVYWLLYMCFPESFWPEYVKVAEAGNVERMMAFMEKNLPEAMSKIWIVNIVQYILFAGIVNVVLMVVNDDAHKVNLKYLSLPFSTYLKVIEFYCITMLVYILSVYMLFIPFIYLGVRAFFVLPLLLEDPSCKFTTAVKQSWNMTKGRFFVLLAFALLCIVFCLAGVFFFFVGAAFAAVFCLFSYVDLYNKCKISNEQ